MPGFLSPAQQLVFVVGVGALYLLEIDVGLDDLLQDKRTGAGKTSVEIYGTDKRFERIAEDMAAAQPTVVLIIACSAPCVALRYSMFRAVQCESGFQ
jgi:hypothetical protein